MNPNALVVISNEKAICESVWKNILLHTQPQTLLFFVLLSPPHLFGFILSLNKMYMPYFGRHTHKPQLF